MLASDEQDLTKSLAGKMPRFSDDFINLECDAKDRIVTRETAIPAIINALVGKIERREKAHCSSKSL
jgi:hypothetical protein